MITRQEVINIASEIVEEMAFEWVPNPDTRYKKGGSTGNMATLGLRYKTQGNYFIVYIDTNIAPYVPYTNELWISPKWKGKKNPNQGWWDVFAIEFINRLNERLKGEIKND